MMSDTGNGRPITLTLSHLHIRRMIENHSLEAADANDVAKVGRIAQRLFDQALGLPEPLWHEWDDWAKGME
jgi:hypothetical protein